MKTTETRPRSPKGVSEADYQDLVRENAELRRAAEAHATEMLGLDDSRRRLRTLIENAPMCIHEIGLDGAVQSMNPSGINMLQLAAESEVVDVKYLSLISDGDRPRVRDLMDAAFRGQRSSFSFIDASGDRVRTFESSFSPLIHDGRVERLIGCTVEVTQRVENEQMRQHLAAQVLHGQKLDSLGLLAGGLAHDFNNLLAAVLANLSVATSSLSPGHEAAVALEAAEAAVKNGAELCKQLLAYAGKGKFESAILSLNSAAMNVEKLVGASLPAHVSLDTQRADPDVSVQVSPGQMEQILLNLILNASAALGEDEGKIDVEIGSEDLDGTEFSCVLGGVVKPGRYAVMSVRDDGPGIPEHIYSRLLEPFVTTEGAGKGLGLAAVAGIVRSYGGAIRVETEIGKGTHFRIYLPQSTEAPAARPASTSIAPKGLHVLVVDDQEVVREATSRLLSFLGFHVGSAASGEEALALFKDGMSVDVALVDVSMPGMSGPETRDALRALNPQLPVVLMSGWEDHSTTTRVNADTKSAFLSKPFSTDALVDAIALATAD